jgi:hypothetical protein
VRAPAKLRRPLSAWAALALSCTLSCARCGTPSAKSAEELLPPGDGAVVTAPLGQLVVSAAALSATAGKLPALEGLAQTGLQLVQQVGVPSLTREGLLAVGLDPARGAALALLPQPEGAARAPWVLALPLVQPEVFAQKLDALLTQRLGYALRTEEARSGLKVVLFSRPGANEKLAYGLVRGYGLLARGLDPAAELAAAAARAQPQSLAGAPKLAWAQKELGPQDVLLLVPEQSSLVARLLRRALPGGAALGLSAVNPTPAGGGLRVRVLQELSGGPLTALSTFLPGPLTPPLPPVPNDALVARVQLAPGQMAEALARVPALAPALGKLAPLLEAKGVKLDQDLFAALAPGAALSLGLSARANLGRSVDPDLLDVRTHSPFDLVQLVATARTEHAGKVRKALAAIAAALPELNATVTRVPEDRFAGCLTDAWQVSYPGGEGIEFGTLLPSLDACSAGGAKAAPEAATSETALVYATGGGGANGAALLLAKTRPSPLTADAAAVLSFDLGELARAVHALPDAAYGSGPQVFVARSLVSQVIDPLQGVRGKLLVKPLPTGVLVELTVLAGKE